MKATIKKILGSKAVVELENGKKKIVPLARLQKRASAPEEEAYYDWLAQDYARSIRETEEEAAKDDPEYSRMFQNEAGQYDADEITEGIGEWMRDGGLVYEIAEAVGPRIAAILDQE